MVPLLDSSLTIDGRLDEAAWSEALQVELAYETNPGENIPAPVRTLLFLAYDTQRLYVGFKAYDPEPSTIRAHLTDRDSSPGDDLVGIAIDPFNDGRRAFEFRANAFGVQTDLVVDDINGTEEGDDSWNVIWDSRGTINAEGYEVEMAIPFSSLRFPKTSGLQEWGFDGLRIYPRNQEHTIRSHPVDRNLSCYVCQFTPIRGFAEANPGINLELNPTLVSSLSKSREELEDPELGDTREDLEPGLTANWGITPNLSLGATINPDFSQVEADVAQLNVNNPFELFFPETRPFFLEGADLFKTPLNAIYSRTIADPDWGLRLTGKQGPHGIGLFTTRDTKTNFILPGSQFSVTASLEQESSASALRYRRDLGQRSVIGVLAANRQGAGYHNRIAGADALLRLSKTDKIRAQILGSRTRYPRELIEATAQSFDLQLPEGEIEDLAYGISYVHQSRNWLVNGRYIDTGKDFRADLGFVPIVDRRTSDVAVERTWWGEPNAKWTRMILGAEWNFEDDHAGQELRQGYRAAYRINGPWQSTALFSYERRNRFFLGEMFEENVRHAFFSAVPNGNINFEISLTQGNDIDFVNVQAGDSLRVESGLNLDLGKHFRAQLGYSFSRLDVAGGRLFTAELLESRLIYQINIRTFLRVITQFTDIRRDPMLYPQGFAERMLDRALLNQFLFSYKINPRTVLFFGYSDSHLGRERIDLVQQNRSLFLKIGYAWVL